MTDMYKLLLLMIMITFGWGRFSESQSEEPVGMVWYGDVELLAFRGRLFWLSLLSKGKINIGRSFRVKSQIY